MSNSDTGMILRENISAGAFTPAPDGVPADSRTARLEQHPKGNERTSPEKTLEIQKLYFNSMIHELNNFLHCVQNGIDLAKIELQVDNGEVDALLDNCARASYKSVCLLRNYSMFLKGDSGRFEYGRIDVINIARTSAKILLRDKRINFLFGTDNISEYVLGDETQLCQLFHNLLKNAKEAAPDNGITIKMDISRTSVEKADTDNLAPGKYVKIRISDSGAGMDKHNIEHLFNPYFTSKKTGTGLGLSVCLGIVRRHKGSIRVDSEPGRGTVFTILLPSIDFQELQGIAVNVNEPISKLTNSR